MTTVDWGDKLKRELADEEVSKYLSTKPATRHEAWLQVTALAAVAAYDELNRIKWLLEDIREQLTGKGGRKKR